MTVSTFKESIYKVQISASFIMGFLRGNSRYYRTRFIKSVLLNFTSIVFALKLTLIDILS
ncbi:hypothetical protein FYB70_01315 [Leptospira interrogans serovar Icterohaemorrhagiae]|nr:hypothetical protein Lepto898_01315 [Leptospira interrogans serovar Icterohaemorrhagiae]WPM71312.1 hypothetical protein FYB70_01315 [Leptospira interrogans serovar Icterohaemorrhagiae]